MCRRLGILIAIWVASCAMGLGQESPGSPQASATKSPVGGALDALQELAIGSRFSAQDSLQCGSDDSADALECLNGLKWSVSSFEVQLEPGDDKGRIDRMVRFASPLPQGDAINDLVAMEWYMALNQDGRPIEAPAMIVVHESGRGMTVGKMIAKGLRAQGIHSFMLHMPGYGVRQGANGDDVQRLLPSMKQAIADVRRARDAVAALPWVDREMIGVQGTSLGGFVTATASGLDAGFHRVFILLAGGDLQKVIFEGAKDAAQVRQRLEESGATQEMILENVRQIEPLRLAHRLRPEITWLYSGKFDDVVPPACAHALADRAGLPAEHHIQMPVDHYSGAILLPKVLLEMARTMGVAKASP